MANLQQAVSPQFLVCTCSGASGAGYIPVSGLSQGDILFKISLDGFDGAFESIVSTNGQLAQLSPRDLSSVTFTFYFIRIGALS